MKKFLAKLLIVSLLAFYFPRTLDSANLTAVADTLSTSRLSYHDHLSVLHTLGTSLINVTTTGNLFTGDTVLIGDTTTATTYTVDDIFSTTQFTTTAGLDATDIQLDDYVIATRSAVHTITFTTATAVPNGAIRILIPAGTNNNNDGIPNHDGFDFADSVGVGATAPTGGGVTSWETATATASGGTGCAAGYHCFEARYNGTNNVNASLTMYIDGLINPSPAHAAGSAGSADTYTFIVQHLKDRTAGNDYAVLDSTTGKIALVESVRVTATVEPTITFTIASVGIGSTACGLASSVATTATTVPFGSMALNTFKNLAQKLTLSTNAVGGGAVTAGENDHLGKDGATTPLIVDSSGDSPGTMTEQVTEDWDTATNNGFGFSLDDDGDGAADVTEAFAYNVVSGNCIVGTYCARQFANLAHADTVKELFNSGSAVVDAGDLFVCYRLSVGATQAAGDYENNITYTATATF
ncbi:MAG: hypothetical protein V1810_01805 [Candidatus Beckwithbacteria bacterium]